MKIWNCFRAGRLLRKAFHTVGRSDARQGYEQALTILDNALSLCPDHAAVHNERGYCLSRLDRLEEAESAHLQAVRLKPRNPKYRNNFLTLQFTKAKETEPLADQAAFLGLTLHGARRLQKDLPLYPSAYLLSAEVLAFSGAPQSVWERDLQVAAEAYRAVKRMPSGLRATEQRIAETLELNTRRCQEAARAGSARFGSHLQPINLRCPEHYDRESRMVGGEPRDLELISGSLNEDVVQLTYEWTENVSKVEADRLDSRCRAFICAALWDGARFAGLRCAGGPPHGRRPSWLIEACEVPWGLRRGKFDAAQRVCEMEVGPIRQRIGPMNDELTGISASLYWSFSTRFCYIQV